MGLQPVNNECCLYTPLLTEHAIYGQPPTALALMELAPDLNDPKVT